MLEVQGGGSPKIAEIEIDARELHVLSRLPDSHAAWPIDAILLSPNALQWLATASGVALAGVQRLFGFWDHAVREIGTSFGRLGIDAAGAYRLLSRA